MGSNLDKRDGAQVLGDLTGLGREGVLSAWEIVKANNAKLKSCPRHDFKPISEKFGSRFKCTHCQGEADSSAVMWYQNGIDHANAQVGGA
jgi:hypothetical protein